MNISGLSLEEMSDDREASIIDIAVCRAALAAGVTHHKDGYPVEERIAVNERIIAAIDAERERRKVET